MRKGKIYTWLSLFIVISFLLCMGVACSNDKPSDATATPSAKTTADGQANPQTTPDSTSTLQGTEAPQSTEDGQAATQTTTQTTTQTAEPPVSSQEDNVVTFPPSWFEIPAQSDGAGTATPAQTGDNEATMPPQSTTKPTQTPEPMPGKTPIGTDEDGWIDIWV